MPVGELETPALCLDLEAYRRNLRRMADYIIRTHGLAWRPHMKGQKAPELAREAVAAGAAGVTCATLYEAEVMVDSGVDNVLLANQVAGERKLARLARLARRARVIAATDSLEHAAQLNTVALSERAIVPVLVEVDVGMKRCGVASGAPAAQLARCVHQMPGLRFLGLMGWEGHAVPLEGEQKQSAIAAAMQRLTDSAEACRAGSGRCLDTDRTPKESSRSLLWRRAASAPDSPWAVSSREPGSVLSSCCCARCPGCSTRSSSKCFASLLHPPGRLRRLWFRATIAEGRSR